MGTISKSDLCDCISTINNSNLSEDRRPMRGSTMIVHTYRNVICKLDIRRYDGTSRVMANVAGALAWRWRRPLTETNEQIKLQKMCILHIKLSLQHSMHVLLFFGLFKKESESKFFCFKLILQAALVLGLWPRQRWQRKNFLLSKRECLAFSLDRKCSFQHCY